jgi:hypothetical protein
MPVSGLVVSAADEEAARQVTEWIARDESFTLGERVGLRLTVAATAPDGSVAEQQHGWLRQLPGVAKVDVAFVLMDSQEANDEGR